MPSLFAMLVEHMFSHVQARRRALAPLPKSCVRSKKQLAVCLERQLIQGLRGCVLGFT